jgi:tetratricopeptide (TPR) repeat protein
MSKTQDENGELAPLENCIKKAMLSKLPAEAIEHFERARNIETEDNSSGLIERASEFALAIKKANGFFPDAHAWLGMTLAELGDTERAKREVQLAVQQDNSNSFARCLLILCEIDKLGMPNVPTNTGSFLVDLLSLGGGVAAAKRKIGVFSGQVDRLVNAYCEDIAGSDNVDYWIFCSEMMLQVHDVIQDIRGLPRKGRIAQAVLDAAWDKVILPRKSGHENKPNSCIIPLSEEQR